MDTLFIYSPANLFNPSYTIANYYLAIPRIYSGGVKDNTTFPGLAQDLY